MLFLQLIATLATQTSPVAVEGYVTDYETGTAIHGARVELVAGKVFAISDSSGHYALAVGRGGSLGMRVLRLGYETQAIELVLPALGALRVDVALRPVPALMPLVRVSAMQALAPRTTLNHRRPDVRFRALGNLATESVLGEADALAAFGGEHDVAFALDVPNSMHVRGGSSDQLRFLIDGVPLYNPTHSAGAFGALNADVIDVVALHTGARSSAFGNALGGTVAASTRHPASDGVWHGRGGISTTALRLTSDGPLIPGRSDLIVSARRGSPSLLAGRPDLTRLTASFTDWLLKSSTRIGAGTVTLLATAANDRTAFSNRSEDDTSAAARGRHAFDWGGGTVAALWNAPIDSVTKLSVNVWRAEFDGDATWLSAEPLHMKSTRQTHGISTTITRRVGTSEAQFGAELQNDRVAYDVMNETTVTHVADATLSEGTRSSVAVFGEHLAPLGSRWTARAGVRALYSGSVYLEPRFATSFHPTSDLAIHAGVARNYQTVQSLRNPESPAAAVFGADLPVFANGNIPVARGDEVTLAVMSNVGSHSRLMIDGYARRLTGLVLGQPESGTPFTLGSPATGTGRVAGFGASFESNRERLTTRLAAGVSRTEREMESRESDATIYQPSFASTRSLTAAVGYRLGAHTSLSSAFFARWGRRTTLFDGSFDWEGCDAFDGGCEIAGTPSQSSTAISGARLPPYLRWDVGARRTWTATLGGRSMDFEAHATIRNVLDRRNVWVFGATAPDQAPRALMQRPLSVLTAGLDFRY